jgi:hypothetical protein
MRITTVREFRDNATGLLRSQALAVELQHPFKRKE